MAPLTAAGGTAAAADSAVTQTVVAAPSVGSESVHVYVITQLEVPDALGRDSVALRAHVQHAVITMVAALTAEQVPIAGAGVLFRQSGQNGNTAPSRADSLRPPASGYERSARRMDATPDRGVMLAVVRR